MIRAIALDDERLALDVIRNFCARTDYIDLQKEFIKAEDATKYLENYPVDLIFLDINMPSITGLEFTKQLPRQVMIIFTTAYSEFAIEGFNLNALDYLLKPFTLQRFQQAVEKAKAYHLFLHQNPATEQDHLLVRMDYGLSKVYYDTILLIEGLDDYIKIYLVGKPPLITRITMKLLTEKLPHKLFARVHRSYFVALNKIDSVRNKNVYIGNHEIPIGRNYEKDFFDAFGK